MPGQVFVVEHFKGSEGGRVLPTLHADGSANAASRLLEATAASFELIEVSALDLVAYVAAVVAHPGFTSTFADELTTPGVRVPLTADPDVWDRAVRLGRTVIWLHTYGAAAADPTAGRPLGSVRHPAGDPRQPRSLTPVKAMPTAMTYTANPQDPPVGEVRIGDGRFGPVLRRVWEYDVGGRNVLASWFGYRRADPAGRRSSPLDDMTTTVWPADWTREFIDLLTVLTRLADLETAQTELLADVLAGPLLSMEALTRQGVHWPTGSKDRRARRTLTFPPN